MKKLLFVGVFAILVGTLCFAGNGSDNGNGGADKIGAYVGWPFGLSYSHEFNDLVELDLVVGYKGYLVWHRLDFQIGALFTVFDPILPALGNQKCPLSLGPVVGVNFSSIYNGYLGTYYTGGFSILLPIRWEMNFGNIPDFNVFFDVALIGMNVQFYKTYDIDSYGNTDTRVVPGVYYTVRAGVGLRYRIPNKK